ESVREFQIMTAGFPADFGRNAGSMVNAVSRSGQTEHHGNGYALLNDGRLNARRFFDKPFVDRVNSGINNGGSFSSSGETFRQFGGTAGGRIAAERLYYFASAQRQYAHGIAVHHFVVPTQDEQGLRVSKSAGGFIPIGRLEEFFRDRNSQ